MHPCSDGSEECIGWPIDPRRLFPVMDQISLPLAANLGAVLIDEGGETGTLHTSPRRLFEHLTSEWNSHLAVHDDVASCRSCCLARLA